MRSAASLWIAGPGGLLDEAFQGLAEPAARVVLYVSEADTSEPDADAAGDADEAVEAGEAADADEDAEASMSLREEVIRVGGPVEGREGQRYVARTGFGYAATARESGLSRIMEAKVDDLLVSDE